MVHAICLLTLRSEISIDVNLKSWILVAIEGKVFVDPHFEPTLIIDTNHFFSNWKASVFDIKIVKAHEGFKEKEETLLKREFVFDLIKESQIFCDYAEIAVWIAGIFKLDFFGTEDFNQREKIEFWTLVPEKVVVDLFLAFCGIYEVVGKVEFCFEILFAVDDSGGRDLWRLTVFEFWGYCE